MNAILTYALARLREPSTWAGLGALLAFAGLTLAPEQLGAISTAGIAIAGLIATFFPDKPA